MVCRFESGFDRSVTASLLACVLSALTVSCVSSTGLDSGWSDVAVDGSAADAPDAGLDIDSQPCVPVDLDMISLPDCSRHIRLPASASSDFPHETCVIVPPGQCHQFWMGSVENEYYSLPQEFPRRMVSLTPYAMSRFPVTVAEYRACMAAGACADPNDFLESIRGLVPDAMIPVPNINQPERFADHPVNSISHSEAVSFCRWVGGRLPTEARYEYAAAGPMSAKDQIVLFPWGADTDECHVNILGADPFEKTSPVGFFRGGVRTRTEGRWAFGPDEFATCDDQSPFGLRDVNHNVMEMTLDGPGSYETIADGAVDPFLSDSSCVGVAVRGSSWKYADIHHARVTNRHSMCITEESVPEGVPISKDVIRSEDTGFRCAFDL